MVTEEDDKITFLVVVNHEEQYSIWPAGRDIPAGWRPAGKEGSKAECLAYIEEVWTDMRPLSLRKKMDRDAGASGVTVAQGAKQRTKKARRAGAESR